MSKKKLTASKKELEKLLKDGWSNQQIANRYEVDRGAVLFALKREGLYVSKTARPRAVFNIRMSLGEVELVKKLRKHFNVSTDSQAVREAMLTAAKSLKLVADDYRPPK